TGRTGDESSPRHPRSDGPPDEYTPIFRSQQIGAPVTADSGMNKHRRADPDSPVIEEDAPELPESNHLLRGQGDFAPGTIFPPPASVVRTEISRPAAGPLAAGRFQAPGGGAMSSDARYYAAACQTDLPNPRTRDGIARQA